MSECFWVLLPRFSLFFFFFFGKGCIQNEEPNSKREYGCNVFMWFKEKDEKYLAFLTALTFHEDYDLDKKKKKRKEKVTEIEQRFLFFFLSFFLSLSFFLKCNMTWWRETQASSTSRRQTGTLRKKKQKNSHRNRSFSLIFVKVRKIHPPPDA